MSKFTCLVLCVVAASLSNVHVAKAEESLSDSLRPVIEACAKEFGVTDANIQAAKEAGSPAGINSCFIDCVLRKAGFINEKNGYDLDTGLKNLRQFVKDDVQYNKLADVAKLCSSVQDKPVTDKCGLGVLLAECFLQHKTNIII